MTVLETVYALVQSDLKDVDAFIAQTLKESSTKSSLTVVEHLLQSPGKRVRPLLVILMAKALGNLERIDHAQLIHVASAIEMIHLASLVHDDIIDEAETRRDQASVNQKWGNEAAVIIGVFLYSISLKLIADAGSLAVLSVLSDAVKGMCDGELYQLADRRNQTPITEERYFSVIQAKTAELFKGACVSGAIVASHPNPDAVAQFGLDLGYLFQLTDDVLDVIGDAASLKKAAGQDLDQGQWTLPLIKAYAKATESEKAHLRALMAHGCSIDEVAPFLEKYKVVSDIKQRCKALEENIDAFLSTLDVSPYRDALVMLVGMIAGRVNWPTNC